jgi:hypothetical protein
VDEYIIIPGGYSGDMWHVAAACYVRPKLRILIGLSPSREKKETEGAEVILLFFRQVGLVERVSVLNAKKKPDHVYFAGEKWPLKGTLDSEYWRFNDEVQLKGKSEMWQHVSYAQDHLESLLKPLSYPLLSSSSSSSSSSLSLSSSSSSGRDVVVPPLYACTSMIMRAMEELGKDAVIRALRSGLTANLDQKICAHIAGYARTTLKAVKERNILFVLGRQAGYNKDHNLSSELLEAIAAAAKDVEFSIVLVGAESLKDIAVAARLENYSIVDLQAWKPLTGQENKDERARAYFWRCVAELAPKLKKHIKFVGGRSGSTDLPAFMGIDVLCWDKCDASNPEYLRLLLTTPLLMSLMHVGTSNQQGNQTGIVARGALNIKDDATKFFQKITTDVLAFLQNKYVEPELVFKPLDKHMKSYEEYERYLQALESAGGKKGKKIKPVKEVTIDLKRPLTELLFGAEIVFTPDTMPLAFESLLQDVKAVQLRTDLSPYFRYRDKGRRLTLFGSSVGIVSSFSFSPDIILYFMDMKRKGSGKDEKKEPMDVMVNRSRNKSFSGLQSDRPVPLLVRRKSF